MNKLICTLFAATIGVGTYSAFAATASSDENSNLGVEETRQQTQQSDSATPDSSSTKSMRHGSMRKGHMSRSNEAKMMDTNNDGMISKDEYMSYEEQKFSTMHQSSEGMVTTRDMESALNGTTRGSNKLQPSEPRNKAPGGT